ncbi:MAG: hypothetical protein R2681_02945 [Pyrinomonadaceae bacterium]
MRKFAAFLFICVLSSFNFGQGAGASKSNKGTDQVRFLVMDDWDGTEKRPNFSALLGGLQNGKYVDARAASAFPDRGSFTLYGPEGPNEGEAAITNLNNEMGDICEDFFGVEIDESVTSGVLIDSDISWNPMPRIPVSFSPKNPVYVKIVRIFCDKRYCQSFCKDPANLQGRS